jgi:replication factor A1
MLNPFQNRFTIKARVSHKSDKLTFNKGGISGTGGQLFYVDLVDAEGDEIRATAFGASVDTLYPIFNVDNVSF